MLVESLKTFLSNFQLPYPPVNVYITNWKITMLSMGKSTISMVIFNSKLLNYQRVIAMDCSSKLPNHAIWCNLGGFECLNVKSQIPPGTWYNFQLRTAFVIIYTPISGPMFNPKAGFESILSIHFNVPNPFKLIPPKHEPPPPRFTPNNPTWPMSCASNQAAFRTCHHPCTHVRLAAGNASANVWEFATLRNAVEVWNSLGL